MHRTGSLVLPSWQAKVKTGWAARGFGNARGTIAAGDGIAHARKDDRDRPRLPLEGSGRRGPVCQDDVGLQADQLRRERSCAIDVTATRTKVHPHVAAIGPTQGRERLRAQRR